MNLNGIDAYIELIGDLLIGCASGNQPQDFAFALAYLGCFICHDRFIGRLSIRILPSIISRLAVNGKDNDARVIVDQLILPPIGKAGGSQRALLHT